MDLDQPALLTIPATSLVRPLLEIHLADLAMARRRSVSTLAAVTRMLCPIGPHAPRAVVDAKAKFDAVAAKYVEVNDELKDARS